MLEEKSITEIIEEVRYQMCDRYCKFPEQYTPEEWEEVFEDICKDCPLDRL